MIWYVFVQWSADSSSTAAQFWSACCTSWGLALGGDMQGLKLCHKFQMRYEVIITKEPVYGPCQDSASKQHAWYVVCKPIPYKSSIWALWDVL